MAVLRRIITEEDPLLHEKSVEVRRFDEALHKLLDDMQLTLYHADGVGLAAPQVGVLKQIVVVDDREHGLIELINPRIVKKTGQVESIEFCLSVPNRGGKVMRSTDIKVSAQDRFGKPFDISTGGRQAIIFQHEIDHLHGILFTDIMIAEISKEEAMQ